MSVILALEVVYPIGSFYIQYPDAASNTLTTSLPNSKNPATLFGGTWSAEWDGANEGTFFCTEGTRINDSDAVTLDRTNGLQIDKFESHLHNNGSVNGGANVSGLPFSGNTNTAGTSTPISDGVSALRTGKSTFPVNMIIRVWKRTA